MFLYMEVLFAYTICIGGITLIPDPLNPHDAKTSLSWQKVGLRFTAVPLALLK